MLHAINIILIPTEHTCSQYRMTLLRGLSPPPCEVLYYNYPLHLVDTVTRATNLYHYFVPNVTATVFTSWQASMLE